MWYVDPQGTTTIHEWNNVTGSSRNVAEFADIPAGNVSALVDKISSGGYTNYTWKDYPDDPWTFHTINELR